MIIQSHFCRMALTIGLVHFLFIHCSDRSEASPNHLSSNFNPDQEVALEEIASGLTSPVALLPLDTRGNRLIADQIGLIHHLRPDNTLADEPLIDLSSRMVELRTRFDERGLLGVALHPDFARNGRIFLSYSAPLRRGAPRGYDHTSHISEFRASIAGDHLFRIDPESEKIILRVDQPQFNHNGGRIAFGPDGFLYLGLGDGGGANDVGLGHSEQGNSQDPTNLLGSILRFDIDRGDPFSVPVDNPFVTVSSIPDITYAYGFRNPWGISFDSITGRLFAADVGQNLYEELNIVRPGGNYGWRIKEGFHCFSVESPNQPPGSCPDVGSRGGILIDPILEYRNSRAPERADQPGEGISIIGGYLYRGSAIQTLQSGYIFGDWSQSFASPGGRLFIAWPDPDDNSERWSFQPLYVSGHGNSPLPYFVLGFGYDHQGELYMLTTERAGPSGSTGRVWKINPSN